MTRSAFVSGAAGFLGRHLLDRLARDGWAVTALCLPTDRAGGLDRLARVVRGDVTDTGSVEDAMPPDPDAVFHIAADTSTWERQSTSQYRVNVLGTATMVDVAVRRGAGRFVYTSSTSAYGYQPGRR